MLSHKARLSKDGKTYCAPFCGAKCKRSDYLRAKARADKLAERLGKGWKPRVWENMGWHCCVVSKDNKWFVYPHYNMFDDSVRYSAGFNEDGQEGASVWWTDAKSPEKAILSSWKRVQKHIKKLSSPPPELP